MAKKIIIYTFIYLLFSTTGCGYFEYSVYTNNSTSGQLEENWNGLNIEIFLSCSRHSYFSWPTLTRKEICKEPYTLVLEVFDDKEATYSYLLINSAEIKYSSGENIILKGENETATKVKFNDSSTGQFISYKFKKLLEKPSEEDQTITVKAVLTLMPSNETKVFSDTFYAKTKINKLNFFEMLEGV